MRTHHWPRLMALIALLGLLVVALPTVPALAASPVTYVVTTTGESAAGDANCAVGSCTLRQAVNASNTNDPGAGNHNTINFNLPSGAQTITLTSNTTLTIAKNVTITGPGAGTLAVDGNHAMTVFLINSGVTATLSGLTIQHGLGNTRYDILGPNCAGAIFNGGTLAVTSSAISDNTAILFGGGIFNSVGATLSLTDSLVSKNFATGKDGDLRGGGGGIDNFGTMAITNSTVSGNIAGILGGGIANGSGGMMAITSSTVNRNESLDVGGGVENSGTLTIANSTVSDNFAEGYGGGIRTNKGVTNTSTLTLTYVTVSDNGSKTFGGGIYSLPDTTLNATNVIIADNLAKLGAPDTVATFATASHTLIGNADQAVGITNGINGNIVGAAALLGPFGDHGGPTQTVSLLPGSPAIDAGACDPTYTDPTTNATITVTKDQRGFTRPYGAHCDIGAYEKDAVATPASITATGGGGQSAIILTPFATRLQATVEDANTLPVGGASVTFTAPSSGPSGTFATASTTCTVMSGGLVATCTTDATTGVATAPVFTANGIAGVNYPVAATVPGVASPATFSLANLPGTATTLIVSGYPSPTTAGLSHPFTVTALDSGGNTATGYTGTIHFTSSDVQAILPGDTTLTNGTGTFTATLKTAGTQRITATDTVTPSITGTQSGISVIAASASSMTANPGTTPQSTTVGTPFPVSLATTVSDPFGNPVSGAGVTFTAPSSGASGIFATSGTSCTVTSGGLVATCPTGSDGVATAPTFTANLIVGANYPVTATVAGIGPSLIFRLTNTAYVITVSPTTLPDGMQGQAYHQNITATGGSGPYTFALSGGTLPGGLTLGGDGVLTGTPTGAGSFTAAITATDTNGFTGSRSYTFTIAAVSITITPMGGNGASVKVGGTLHLTATDGMHHDVTQSVQWQSSDRAIAAVDGNGVVTGESPGQVLITATLNGVTASVLVTVPSPTPIGITVPPAPASRPSGAMTVTAPPLPVPPRR